MTPSGAFAAYRLADGEPGTHPTIPGKATLIFEVGLLDWR